MQFTSPILGVLALQMISNPAAALDTWSATVERGLPALSLKAAEGAPRVICDPDRVFGPTPNGGVAVQFPKDADPAMIVFLATSGEQVRLPLKNGFAAQAVAEPAEWAKMIAILRQGGAFAVVTTVLHLT